MNIFFLDEDPKVAARMLCDKHLSKMQLESGQILSTVLRQRVALQKDCLSIYKATHHQHPSTVWVSESRANLEWFYLHVWAMDSEWRALGKLSHKSFAVSQLCAELLLDLPWQQTAMTAIPLCMPDEVWATVSSTKFTDLPTAVWAYRSYYLQHKSHIATWKNRSEPTWWSEAIRLRQYSF